MKIIESCEQGDLDWLKLRVGKVTASEIGNLLSPEFAPRTGEMPKTYLFEKVAEAFQGRPLPAFGSWQTDQGLLIEEEAIPWFQLETGCALTRPAFIEHEDGRCGCSPDAVINGNEGLEVKSPQAVNHVRYLLDGVVPKQYIGQVHFSLYVTGFKKWTFLSYRRGFPKLIVETKRDPRICDIIENTLRSFYERFDDAMQQLTKLKQAA